MQQNQRKIIVFTSRPVGRVVKRLKKKGKKTTRLEGLEERPGRQQRRLHCLRHLSPLPGKSLGKHEL